MEYSPPKYFCLTANFLLLSETIIACVLRLSSRKTQKNAVKLKLFLAPLAEPVRKAVFSKNRASAAGIFPRLSMYGRFGSAFAFYGRPLREWREIRLVFGYIAPAAICLTAHTL